MTPLNADVSSSRMIKGNPLRERSAILKRYAIYLAICVSALAIGTHILYIETDWERMGTGKEIIFTIMRFSPDFPWVIEILSPLWDTVLIAFWGTTLATTIAIPVAYLAARNMTPAFAVTYPIGRGLIVLSRSTHEIIFALLFVSALGLGALPGILALGCRSVGFLAKTTAEAIENVDHDPIEAMEATGAGPIHVFLFGVIPQVLPIFIGNVIFELDINIRRAAILGLVGAGGIGLIFAQHMMAFELARAGTCIMAITTILIVGEFISNRIRNRLI